MAAYFNSELPWERGVWFVVDPCKQASHLSKNVRIRPWTHFDCVWNVMTHAQEPDFVFQRNGRVHLNRHGRQFSRLLATELGASTVVMLDTPCSEVVWRVLATHSIRQFPLNFPSRVSPLAITFQLDSNNPHNYPSPCIAVVYVANESYRLYVVVLSCHVCNCVHISPAFNIENTIHQGSL